LVNWNNYCNFILSQVNDINVVMDKFTSLKARSVVTWFSDMLILGKDIELSKKLGRIKCPLQQLYRLAMSLPHTFLEKIRTT
jgi:hypothetical protein